MNKILNKILLLVLIVSTSSSFVYAQMSSLNGTITEHRMGLHSGNQFRTTFYNDGTYGAINPRTPDEFIGEWPINSGHYYLVDGNIFVGSEVTDPQGNLFHILSENISYNTSGSRGDFDQARQKWQTFLPLPGFANATGTRVAMAKGSSQWPGSWPSYWPDIADPKNPYGIYEGSGWAGSWNGYFGRDVFNADEESYFVADDYQNDEFIARFKPDNRDAARGGLGLRLYVRGFQWAKAAVEDALFVLLDIENIGTTQYDKMVFAYKIGNNMGESTTGTDTGDDNAEFVRAEDLAYMTDNDDIGAGSWSPVGFFGGAFLESPGNPYDGIDNDNDGANTAGPVVTSAMFQPKTLNINDQIVIINYQSPIFERRITTLGTELQAQGKGPQDSLKISVNGRSFRFWAGKSMQEIGDNIFDDNLNGLIDESRGAPDANGIFQYLYEGYKCVDYITGAGKNNLLLDERRDDNLDNDGDWDPLLDDVGSDGIAPGTTGYTGPDNGESDGIPTAGEPHFDKTDIDETDMLGLTTCNLYEWSSVTQYDDEGYWNIMVPGTFSIPVVAQNVELLYGSGYFPSVPGQVERISMGILCGLTRDELLRTKQNVALAYNQNYNFAKAPYIPTITQVVPGDNKVTLFWNSYAELSDDPISGMDFEGYKIYRSTDPGFTDATPITDGYGSVIFRQPIAQFDVDNDYRGFAAYPTSGVHFWLGDNSGLRHFWTDTTAVNGTQYFYAVASYDHGDPSRGIDPSECTKFVAVQSSGEIEHGSNVAVVKPEAPAAGYIAPKLSESGIAPGANNSASGSVSLNIMDPYSIKDQNKYSVTFTDTLSGNFNATKSFVLKNLTTGQTVYESTDLAGGTEGLPATDGFQLVFANNPAALSIDSANTAWNVTGVPRWDFKRFSLGTQPVRLLVTDFELIMSDLGVDTSKTFKRGTTTLNPIPVNFTVIDKRTNKKIPFAFRDQVRRKKDETGKNIDGLFEFDPRLRRSDEIILLADPAAQVASWQIGYFVSAGSADTITPGPGSSLKISLFKPFLSNDSYEFTTLAQSIDNELAKSELDKIKVVPNPYIATNSWEPRNPYANGRGDRELHFTHLPAKCTIKIFNVRGQLVKSIDHDAALDNGTEVWNMLSRDNLEISYGIYIYHVKADGIGEKTGKFVVIK